MNLSMDRNVEWEYLHWLTSMVGLDNGSDPTYSYSLLAEQLFRKEFTWTIENDENRAEMGLGLRDQFRNQYGGLPIVGPSSVLEVMVSLADKLAFDMSDESEDLAYWFQILLANTGLNTFTDAHYIEDYTTKNAVYQKIMRILLRRYSATGEGGFFPLARPMEDQREVELWFQLASFVLERSGYR